LKYVPFLEISNHENQKFIVCGYPVELDALAWMTNQDGGGHLKGEKGLGETLKIIHQSFFMKLTYFRP